jgi:hypothetical protein
MRQGAQLNVDAAVVDLGEAAADDAPLTHKLKRVSLPGGVFDSLLRSPEKPLGYASS